MTSIGLTINGQHAEVEVQPRTSLADLLRERIRLTGTHLGCEHGVCGACTVLVDDIPVRSCIVLAVACEGRVVRPIEAFEDDAVMEELRQAFRREHALQCGFCTPGMLIAARDIVLRIPNADERRIRRELAGNLCRCTGYVGIVKAVQSVIQVRRGQQVAPSSEPAREAVSMPTASKRPAIAWPVQRAPQTASTSAPELLSYRQVLRDPLCTTPVPARAGRALSKVSSSLTTLPRSGKSFRTFLSSPPVFPGRSSPSMMIATSRDA